MPQAKKRKTRRIPIDKTFFDLSGGLHTESSALNFPDNVTLDETNMEMLTDGTRRRRRGLNYEEGLSSYVLPESYIASQGTQLYTWRNVDNNPDKTLIVIQLGTYLYFYEDGVTLGDNRHEWRVNLGFYVTEAENTQDIVTKPISFAHGRGRLFVANSAIEPLSIQYTGDDSEFLVETINIKIRPFEDLDDGIGLWERPDTATTGPSSGFVDDITNAHEWNLRNRGWIFGSESTGADNFVTQQLQWPAKSMIPYAGYYAHAAITDADGSTVHSDIALSTESTGWYGLGHTKGWSSDKINDEIFGNSYVPRGSFVHSIFDNEFPEGVAAGAVKKSYKAKQDPTNPNFIPLSSYWRNAGMYSMWAEVIGSGDAASIRYHIALKDDLPPAGGSEEVLVGDIVSTPHFGLEHVFSWGSFPDAGSDANTPTINWSRAFEIAEVDYVQNTIAVDAKVYLNGVNWSQYFLRFREPHRSTGESTWNFQKSGAFQLVDEFNADGDQMTFYVKKPTERPSANAWFAGRIWHAGMSTTEWADTLFFSKTIITDTEYGWSFQAADPTHPGLNTLIPTDGGTLQIPNVGNIIDMRAMESALLVFSDQGVWEVSGGNFFSATDIRVRQITTAEAVSNAGIVELDSGIVYTSHRGIYALARSGDASGAVVATNLIEESVQTYWNELSYAQQKKASLSFDESKSRLYIAHSSADDGTYKIDTVLILDLRIGGFFKYSWDITSVDAYPIGIHSTDQSSQPDEYQKMKFFIVKNEGKELQIADFSQIIFTDFEGTETLPYILTGYDNLGDFSRQRWAPTIYTYMGTTETGVNEFEDADRSSAMLMQARWDFATDLATGEFGASQEIYRRVRPYAQQVGEDGTEGYDVVVNRSKIRGRGRALQLKFTGEAGKDCHLLGFAIHYQGYGEV